MIKSNSANKSPSSRSVNVRVNKPSGISSVWNWLTSKSKKTNNQNVTADKKVRLKLNPDELETLKRNGIDLQKLQNIAASNNDRKMRKVFVFSKDDMKKNAFLNNNILNELMKNKADSKKKYKKSVASTSSLSIKSRNNVTYIHSIKSKKSIVNSVSSSKASLKVGLKRSTMEMSMNQMNKAKLLKGIPESLLKGNTTQKVFVPIYLGKKKSGKINRNEKNKSLDSKSKIENDLSVIPLLLKKLKDMEGQISDIENTTKKINEVVSQKNMFKNKKSKVGRVSTHQSINKGGATHKIRSKKRHKKTKQNKSELKNKTTVYTTYNAGFKVFGPGGCKSSTCSINYRPNTENIKTILEDPKNIMKHTFVIPEEVSEKNRFTAHPNAGREVIMKLFEALADVKNPTTERFREISRRKCETNGNHIQTKELLTNIQDKSTDKSKLNNGDELKSFSSISESQIFINKGECQNKKCPQKKKNMSCPSSSTDVRHRGKAEEEKLPPETTVMTEQVKDQVKTTENASINMKTSEMIENYKNTTAICLLGNESNMTVPKGALKESKAKNETKITEESFEGKENEDITRTNTNCSNSTPEPMLICNNETEMHKMQLAKMIQKNKMDDSSIKLINYTNLKTNENNNLNTIKLEVSEGQLKEKVPVLKVPVQLSTNSVKICSICIEPTEDGKSHLAIEADKKGIKPCEDTKTDPKLSITIMVKNHLGDKILYNNEITTSHDNICGKTSLPKVGDDQESALPVTEEDEPAKQACSERNVNYNSEKFIPPLKVETSEKIPLSLNLSNFIDKNSFNNEKSLSKNNFGYKTDGFGIEGVNYLNQEQRKKLEENSVKNQVCEELKTASSKTGTKSSIDLKNNKNPIKHLSESSLNLQNTPERKVLKKSTQQRIKTCNKISLKNSRKTPYKAIECMKFIKEVDLKDKPQLESADTELNAEKSLQCADISLGEVLGNKEELYILSDMTNSLYRTNQYDVFSALTTIDYESIQKQDFFVVCNEEPTENEKNTEIKDSPNIKKRSPRGHMTLKEPVLQDTPSEVYEQMGKGDYQTKNIKLITTKEIAMCQLIEHPEKSSLLLNNLLQGDSPPYKEESNIQSTEPNVTNTSERNRSTSKEYILSFRHSEVIPSCIGILTEATWARDGEKNGHFNNQSHGKGESAVPKESLGTFCDSKPEDIKKPSSCPCILTVVEKPGHFKLNCELATLSLNEMPKCCNCILDRARRTTDTIFKSQAQLLMESSGPGPGKIWKIALICNVCMKSARNPRDGKDNNSKNTCRTTCSSHAHADSDFEKNPHDTDGFNGRKEIRAGVFEGKRVRSDPVIITCETSPHPSPKTNTNKLCKTLQNRDNAETLCHHNCFTIPSDDSMGSDFSDKNQATSVCCDLSHCSNEHDICSGILRYYTSNNEEYSLENVLHSTTVFHFDGKEKIKFYKIIPDEEPEDVHETENYDCCATSPTFSDNNYSKFSTFSNQNDDGVKSSTYKEKNDYYKSKRFSDQCDDAKSKTFRDKTLDAKYSSQGEKIYFTKSPMFNDKNYGGICATFSDKHDCAKSTIYNDKNDYTKRTNCEEHFFQNYMGYKEKQNINFPISVNSNQEYPLKNYTSIGNSYFQKSNALKNFIPEGVSPVMAMQPIYPVSADIQLQCLAKCNQSTTTLKKNMYKSYKSSKLKTIQEIDSEQNLQDSSVCEMKHPSSPIISTSTNFIVNCVHSVEYDFMSDDRNSLFACLVNSYSTINSKMR